MHEKYIMDLCPSQRCARSEDNLDTIRTRLTKYEPRFLDSKNKMNYGLNGQDEFRIKRKTGE